MRVLVIHHFPFNGSPSGRHAKEMAAALHAAGHEVHCLIADTVREGSEPFTVRRIVCRAGDASADLDFDVPGFAAEAANGHAFEQLSDQQLAAYRETFRHFLDREVADFDPQVIHVEHIWVLGQLALETGVSYVVSAWEAEFESYTADPRYRALADQAAENAGKILVEQESLRRQIVSRFHDVDERTLVAPELSAEMLTRLYTAAFAERFGRAP